MNKTLPGIVEQLDDSISKDFHEEGGTVLSLKGRTEVYAVLDSLLSVMFPGVYSSHTLTKDDINFFLNDVLRHISFTFLKILEDVYRHYCFNEIECSHEGCADRAKEALSHLMESLPMIRKELLQDVQQAFKGDPAAKSFDEVVLSYPFIDAIATHRIAHTLYKLEVPIIPRIMSERAHARTGIDIHPGASIKPGFFIDHGTGVVIGETCKIGKNVQLYQGVTLGALSPFDRGGKPLVGQKRHPDIEDNVIIYANATILGGETVIGRDSIIGGNTWITESVPPESIVFKNGIKKRRKLNAKV